MADAAPIDDVDDDHRTPEQQRTLDALYGDGGFASWTRTLEQAKPEYRADVLRNALIDLYRLAEQAGVSHVEISDWGVLIGERHNVGFDANGLQAIIADAKRIADSLPAQSPAGGSDAPPETGAKPNCKQLVVYDASSVEPESVGWLWPGRIGIGKTTLFGGDPGLGKSQLSISIASTISQGGEWPCGEGKSPKRSVVMLSAEDGVADTIIPRLLAAGADREKIKIVTAVHNEDGTGRRIFDLTQDLDVLESLITKLGDVGLVTIDPVDAYIGSNVDSHKNAAMRAVLEPISEMADRLDVAILALTHFSKQTANRAIYRFIGSIAQIGAARIAYAIVADPEDKTRVLLLHAKNNLAPPQHGLAFRIEQHPVTDDGVIGSSVYFEPKHVTGVSADDALAAENEAGQTRATDEVQDFLSTILANGRVKIQDIEAEARSAGLLGEDKQMRQSKPFRSAKADLYIVSTREGFGPDAIYCWSLPEHASSTADATMRAPETNMCAHDKNRAHMENEGAHGDPDGVEGAYGSVHARPETPCAPSSRQGAHEGEGIAEGAHGGNGRGAPGDLDIPAFLDRRSEVDRVCAQCGAARPGDLPTIAVTPQDGTTVFVHEHGCLKVWEKEHGACARR